MRHESFYALLIAMTRAGQLAVVIAEKRFTQTGTIFPARSLASERFKFSSQNDRPNDFLSLRYDHVVVSAGAAVGPSPAACILPAK